jgi:uncharacterized protein
MDYYENFSMALIHSWLNPKLEVKSASGSSYKGIFAKAPVSDGERVAIFGGYVMKIEDEPVFSEDRKDLAVQIDERFVIGTKHEGEIEDTDFFNHSCNPNAGFKGQIFLVAMRDIPAGEEVTFDYAMVLHEATGMPKGYEFTCFCGSPQCRGKVTNNDWKIAELQGRYGGYFSWYLQEKINRVKR